MRLCLLCFVCALSAQQRATDSQDLADLSGRTVDLAGNPVRKTLLTLQPMLGKPGEMRQPYSTTADAAGNFIFDGVEPGRYLLIAQHSGYRQQTYGAKKNSAMAAPLVLGGGQKMTELVFPLTPLALISGKIVDEDGDGVARVQVRLMQTAYVNGKRQAHPTGFATSDESGEFRLTGVAPGRYTLCTMAIPNRMFGSTRKPARALDADKPPEVFAATCYPGVAENASPSAVEVAPGQNLPGIDIRLRKTPLFHIAGRLAGSGPRARINLIPRDDVTGFANGIVTDDGSFELQGVAPGAYFLTATNAKDMSKVIAHIPVNVSNRNIDDLVLSVEPGSTLQGSVKIDQPSAIKLPATRVSLILADGPFPPRNVAADADGNFSFAELPAGNYTVGISPVPEGTYLKSIRYGNQDVLASGLHLVGGSALVEIEFATDGGTVEGTVAPEHGQSITGSLVTLVPDPLIPDREDLNRSAASDENGHFSIKSIAPGKYRVYAWDDVENGAPFDPDFLKTVNGGGKVTVESNGHQQISIPLIGNR